MPPTSLAPGYWVLLLSACQTNLVCNGSWRLPPCIGNRCILALWLLPSCFRRSATSAHCSTGAGGLPAAGSAAKQKDCRLAKTKFDRFHILCIIGAAGWSSLVARRAHNPKVVGSNPTPATRQNKGESVTYWFAFFVSILPNFLCDRFVTYV